MSATKNRAKIFISFPEVQAGSGSTQLYIKLVQTPLPRDKAAGDVILATHLYPLQRLRLNGAKPSVSCTSSWRYGTNLLLYNVIYLLVLESVEDYLFLCKKCYCRKFKLE
jgi:hypothetical protein